MKTRFNNPTLFVLSFALLLMIATGCNTVDADEEQLSSISGIWEGPITHPNPDFSGTLKLTITQVGNALQGSANWRYDSRPVSGTLTGTYGSDGFITFSLDFGRSGFFQHEAELESGRMEGIWESATRRGLAGTISLEKQ